MRRIPHPSPAMVVAGISLFVALGGTGYAVLNSSTIPDADGVFHACVHKKTGAVRLVEANTKCKSKTKKRPGELAASWSQRGPAGAPGTNGTNGSNGTSGSNGAAGRDGTSVILRPRSTGEVTTNGLTAQPVPMSPAAWTQAADESNQLLGEVTYDPPTQSACSTEFGGPASPASLVVLVKLGGVVIGRADGDSSGDGSVVTKPLTLNSLVDPGASTARSLTVEATDTCGVPGGAATTRFVIKSVKINVASLR